MAYTGVIFFLLFIIIGFLIALIVLYATGTIQKVGPTGPSGIPGTATNTGATGPTGPPSISPIATTSYQLNNINLTSFGQPTMSNCTLNLQSISTGLTKQVICTLKINQSIKTTGPGTWDASSIIPLEYRPRNDDIVYFPVYEYSSNQPNNFINTFFYINGINGGFGLFSGEPNGSTIAWSQATCVYDNT